MAMKHERKVDKCNSFECYSTQGSMGAYNSVGNNVGTISKWADTNWK